MRNRAPNRAVCALAALVVAVAVAMAPAPAAPAYANGDAVEIFRGRTGSYEVVVRILPENPTVGAIHFSITPLDIATSLPVPDALIVVVAFDDAGEPTYQARALNSPTTPRYYEANITFGSMGEWTLRIEIKSAALGTATLTLPLEVAERHVTPGVAGSLVFLVLMVVLMAGGTYVWYSARRQRRAASE